MTDDDRTREVALTRYQGAQAALKLDHLAHEEPLEISVGGASLAVVMRTPGDDEELALGFLVTEGVVRDLSEVRSVRHCDQVTSEAAEDNILRVVLADGVELDLERLSRNLFSSSSCGLCGKASIDNILVQTAPLHDDVVVSVQTLYLLPQKLAAEQRAFGKTGGLHAAALATPSGELRVVREDVGRHNAVDKVIGWALRQGLVPLRAHILVVSGRVSFEVVQKAAVARVPVVCAISAPTSLAVELAERLGVTLVCFVRGETLNVYSAPARVRADAS